MFDQFQNRELQSSTAVQKICYVEITDDNRCERIPTFTGRLLITLGTIKSFPEITGRDLSPEDKSPKFFISRQCLQNEMLLTLVVFVAKAIISPQFLIFSLSIVNDAVHLT